MKVGDVFHYYEIESIVNDDLRIYLLDENGKRIKGEIYHIPKEDLTQDNATRIEGELKKEQKMEVNKGLLLMDKETKEIIETYNFFMDALNEKIENSTKSNAARSPKKPTNKAPTNQDSSGENSVQNNPSNTFKSKEEFEIAKQKLVEWVNGTGEGNYKKKNKKVNKNKNIYDNSERGSETSTDGKGTSDKIPTDEKENKTDNSADTNTKDTDKTKIDKENKEEQKTAEPAAEKPTTETQTSGGRKDKTSPKDNINEDGNGVINNDMLEKILKKHEKSLKKMVEKEVNNKNIKKLKRHKNKILVVGSDSVDDNIYNVRSVDKAKKEVVILFDEKNIIFKTIGFNRIKKIYENKS